VIIGPNGSGKSNLIEVIELLRATPVGLAAAIRDGGGAREWLWKGSPGAKSAKKQVGSATATLDVRAERVNRSSLRYKLSFASAGARTEVVDEVLEEAEKDNPRAADVYFYYRFRDGHPTLNIRGQGERRLQRESLAADESVLSQRKDPELYPELSWCATQFSGIQTFREWSFGRYAGLRQPQPANLPTDVLLPDASNLGLLLNQLDHSDDREVLNETLRQFLPRFQRVSTLVQGGTVQFFIHEDGLSSPIPATRLSDGTMRFLAMTTLFFTPTPPPLVCIEEPELGLHPDALSLLAKLLVDASQRTQLIVTTHSDVLISALSDQVESVLVCEHRGGTHLQRLDADHLQHWLEDYRLGDLWRMGKLGGNP
jgi:predicted ATPase